ncbi:MAG: carbohydrate kinase family protein [Erysipelotrichaceae bacterium]|nr:carbohydrate kinase family protein [Erysipelotrichaceae bacterium]
MKKVLIIGTACIDIIVDGVKEDVLSSFSVRSKENLLNFGGDGLNEAVILANSGIDTSFVTTLGNDDAGKAIYNYCLNNNVKISDDCFIDEKTNVSVILIDEMRKRHFISTLSGSMRELSVNNIHYDLDDIDIVSLGSMFISNRLNDDEMCVLFEDIKRKNKILCADMVKPKHNEKCFDMKCLKYLDYFFPNDIEALYFTDKNTIEEAAEELFKCGIKNVIIKCGKKGCYIRNKELSTYVNALIVDNIIDTTGAGDSFVAGFIHGMSKDMDIIESAKLGHKFASKCIVKNGANSWSKNLKVEEIL